MSGRFDTGLRGSYLSASPLEAPAGNLKKQTPVR